MDPEQAQSISTQRALKTMPCFCCFPSDIRVTWDSDFILDLDCTVA